MTTDTETAVDELPDGDSNIEATEPEDDSATSAEEADDESPDQDDSDDADGEEQEKPKPKRRRDNRLANARARNAELEAQLAAMQQVAQQPAEEVAPKQTDFATYEEFNAATASFNARAATRAEMQRIAQEANQGIQAQRVAQIETEWTAKEDAAREKHDDYDEVTRADGLLVSTHMKQALQTADEGAEVAYWLGKHPDEAARIARAPTPAASVFELGKLAAKVARRPSPKLPGQPDPVKPLKPRGSGGNASPASAKSMDEFVRLRRKEMDAE